MKIYQKRIIWFGNPMVLICDGKCGKAWGISGRARNPLSDDPDDYEFLADSEVGEAPDDPGTYEGGHAKPSSPAGMNKWCARECERSAIVGSVPSDFSKRVPNRAAPEADGKEGGGK